MGGEFDMAQQYSLDVQTRTVFGKKVKNLRAQKLIPGVIYGAGFAPLHVSIPTRALEIVLAKASGTHLITLNLDGQQIATLAREVQRHAIRRDILHIDFLHVDMAKKVTAEVKIVLINVPKLTSDVELTYNMNVVQIEALPGNLPEQIEVDASRLTGAGTQLTVADLPVVDGIAYMLSDETEIIARVIIPVEQVEEDDVAVTVAEPEVIKKGKKEEEDF